MNLFARSAESHFSRILAMLLCAAMIAGTTATASTAAVFDDNSAAASAQGLSAAFRLASDKVLHAVVAIESTKEGNSRTGESSAKNWPREEGNPFKGSPFEDLLPRGFGQQPGTPQRHGQVGIGSGVIVHRSGLILTNNHVVDGADKVTVRLQDGREFKAVDVKTDPKTDLAILRIEGDSDFPFARLGNSDKVEVGDWVIALGQPFGLESTVTAGIISAKHRGIGITARENFLQTDAAINPGNSGGPLVNLDGEVIGINTAISSAGGGNDGIGFAIPINLAKWVGRQLVSTGKVTRAYLGVGIQPMTADLAKKFHVAPHEGVLVNQVQANTPAERAGLQSGDIIVEFAGHTVSDPRELQLSVERAETGKSCQVTIVREGKRLNLALEPEVQPDDLGVIASSAHDTNHGLLEELGIAVDELTPSVAKRLGMDGFQGVLVSSVRAGSPAHRQGIEAGSVITQVNHQRVENLKTLRSALESSSAEEGVLLSVHTQTGSRFVALKS